MDLLDRYLAAVSRELPERQRADVVAELRDDLMSRIEAEEDRLGRGQSDAELKAMLHAYGHPLTVAGRYHKMQHLVGPDIFPFWWAWLRAGLAIVGAVYVALMALSLFSAGGLVDQVGDITPSLSYAAMAVFTAVTLAAAAIERWGKPRLLAGWSASDLPAVGGKPKSRFELALELCMSLAFLAWWFGLIQFDNWLPRQNIRLDLAPVWSEWFLPIAVYAVIDVVAHLVALVWAGRVRLHLALSSLGSLFGAAVLAAVFREGHFVVASGAGLEPGLQDKLDQAFAIVIACILFALLARAALDAWRLWRTVRIPPRAPRAVA